MKSTYFKLAILAAAGLADASYLSFERLSGGTLACPVTGTGCDTVQGSWYAAPMGIPIAYIGVLGYLLILIVSVIAYKVGSTGKLNLQMALKALTVVAVSASVGLFGIQAFAIGAFCFWCLVSSSINVMLFCVALAGKPMPNVTRGRAAPKTASKNLSWLPIAGIVVILAMALVAMLSSAKSPEVTVTASSLAYPTKGDAKAPVTVVVYSDFQCPACAEYSKRFEPEFDRLYVATGKVKVEYRDFPLRQHRNAVRTAMAARIAGDQNAFWPMHDLLFARQGEWQSIANPNALFISYAKSLGLNVQTFSVALESNKYRDVVIASGNESMKAGINSTPTIFVNGEKISSWSIIPQAVDTALVAASTTR